MSVEIHSDCGAYEILFFSVLVISICVAFSSSAGELLEGIHYVPHDHQEKRQNVEKVLQFMSSKRIRMPQTSARGLCPTYS